MRIVRDWFYDEKMHGVDWTAMKKRYGALVPYVAHRADLDFLFGEIMGELESGHTYVASGDEPKVPRVAGRDARLRVRGRRLRPLPHREGLRGRELGRGLALAAHGAGRRT